MSTGNTLNTYVDVSIDNGGPTLRMMAGVHPGKRRPKL